MKHQNKFHFPTKYLLAILTFLCVIMIVLSFIIDDFARPVKNTVAKIVIPIQSGMNDIGIWLTDKSDNLKELNDVMSENEALKKELAELKESNALSVQEKNELQRLRELYELDSKYNSYSKIGASIISKDSGNWFSTFTINKGAKDGIKVDMNVIGNGGLVGIVAEVGDNYSIVRAIIDDESNVSAQFSSTSDECIVKGDLMMINEGVLSVINIDKDAKIADGDMIVTSNISQKFLPGILIGYVKNIKDDPNNLTKSAQITPVVDFAHLEEVLVITELKDTGKK
ncbi:MAG: rod shape-determining protein MreC [Lachnospiraceae bacterium]|nr:rod shape-determining protein MreC [Lachnospiraceae bacterium]